MIAILDGKRLSAVMETIGEQASIARKSGVSRAQLGRARSGNEARVRRAPLSDSARALEFPRMRSW